MDEKQTGRITEGYFLNKERFAEEIEHLVIETGMNYIDAIVEYCKA